MSPILAVVHKNIYINGFIFNKKRLQSCDGALAYKFMAAASGGQQLHGSIMQAIQSQASAAIIFAAPVTIPARATHVRRQAGWAAAAAPPPQ